ncbi:50S ribosomal protein L24 [Legionella lansingensis]|uniref:Large ribosomal subunit protein uL24 n=1 Tax=Legionella lansingensis TaxID=45067 RepID=A0A0W0VGG5_9GAMM|nr:50S ribosomal protein L24 [Legionella lansingensis]KTD19183.1 50S ribosomal protein L24 [Legionella lansingensis]SNV45190.1 50S ribosomal protein L24 [Legionella lansingensis]
MNRIRSGDTVIVTVGKSKGHVGKVMKVLGNTVVVEGGNLIKKHLRPNPQLNQQGGIITREAPIHVSNVAMYNPVSKKADKVGFKFLEKDGKTHKVRYFKSNDEVIELV